MTADATDTRRGRVVVVGAGLAGLTAAMELVERGFHVVVCEADDVPGGKCGARWNGTYYEEHAYHILPAWYVNFWSLVDRLGLGSRFHPQHDYFYLAAGEFPRMRSFRDVGAIGSAWHNLRSAVMPPGDVILLFYSLLDTLTTRFDRNDWYDQLSVLGFLRRRWYMNPRVARSHEDFLFKTFAVPSYITDLSSYRSLYAYWLKSPKPMMRLPDGDIHSRLIEPLTRRLSERGCEIRLATKVTRVLTAGTAARGVEIQGPESRPVEIPADAVILGVPAEALIPLLTDDLLALSPALSRVRETTSVAIGSLTIKFKKRLADLPRGIMTLEGSRYGLTLVDNGQLWGLDTTLLNVVATDVVDLRHRDEPAAAAAIVDEVRRFIPFDKGDVERVSYLPHERQPLFASTVGSWLFRPEVAGHARGLYLCGDYCRSHVGVVCAEAAVTTGLLAAQACCVDFAPAETVDVKRPREFARWTARICKLVLTPIVILIVAWNSIARSVRGARPRGVS